MDAAPFSLIPAEELDVLMCYDYTDLILPQEFLTELSGYQEIVLLAWSMGVWAGQHLLGAIAPRFARTVAVNGTLCPLHDQYGIPIGIYRATMDQFDARSRLKFYRRMCRRHGILERFLSHQPTRTVADQLAELVAIWKTADCIEAESALYSEIVISVGDQVMSSTNQQRYWRHKEVRLFEGSHFLFYDWNSWDALLEEIHDKPAGGALQTCKGSQGR